MFRSCGRDSLKAINIVSPEASSDVDTDALFPHQNNTAMEDKNTITTEWCNLIMINTVPPSHSHNKTVQFHDFLQL